MDHGIDLKHVSRWNLGLGQLTVWGEVTDVCMAQRYLHYSNSVFPV